MMKMEDQLRYLLMINAPLYNMMIKLNVLIRLSNRLSARAMFIQRHCQRRVGVNSCRWCLRVSLLLLNTERLASNWRRIVSNSAVPGVAGTCILGLAFVLGAFVTGSLTAGEMLFDLNGQA